MNSFPPNPTPEPEPEKEQPHPVYASRRESQWIKAVAIISVIGLAALLFWPSDKPLTDLELREPPIVGPVGIEHNGATGSTDEITGLPDAPELAEAMEGDIPSPAEPSTQSGQPTQANVTAPVPRFDAPAVGSGNYFVQVGSFARPENAKKLSDKLLSAWPVLITPTSSGWHRVQVGPFTSRSAAAKALATLKKNYKVDGFIAKHD